MNRQEKEDLILQLNEKFQESKREIGFKSSFDDIETAFFIKDRILSDGFVSDSFSRQMCSRINDTLGSWVGYLHSLLMPNPQLLMSLTEARLFSEEERKEIRNLIKEAMALESLNTLAGLTKDIGKEREFIDGAVRFWKDSYLPGILKVVSKVNKGWSE